MSALWPLAMPILIFLELTYLHKFDWQGGVEEQAIADLEEIRGIPPCKYSDSDAFSCICMYVCTVFMYLYWIIEVVSCRDTFKCICN